MTPSYLYDPTEASQPLCEQLCHLQFTVEIEAWRLNHVPLIHTSKNKIEAQ